MLQSDSAKEGARCWSTDHHRGEWTSHLKLHTAAQGSAMARVSKYLLRINTAAGEDAMVRDARHLLKVNTAAGEDAVASIF